ncbi:MAG: hypothetical protein JXQ72_07150 [Anaerolineae bacterium]|nr:hypothetical protein [Anaerolineae bacterium]
MRAIRLGLGVVALVVFGLGVLGYVIYAANGILDKVDEQNRRDTYDRQIALTATALQARLTALAQPAGSEAVEETAATPVPSVSPDSAGTPEIMDTPTLETSGPINTLVPTPADN